MPGYTAGSSSIRDAGRGGAGPDATTAKYETDRFAVHGLEPGTEVPVYFLEPTRKLGAVVNFSVKLAASGPVTVRLEPCGAAKARVVDASRKPVAGHQLRGIVTMVVAPGPPYSRAKDQAGRIAADEAELNQIDAVNYKTELVADAEGRLILPVLIPGATYRFIDYTTVVGNETGPAIRKEFTVKSGETLDLGEILIEKPRS